MDINHLTFLADGSDAAAGLGFGFLFLLSIAAAVGSIVFRVILGLAKIGAGLVILAIVFVLMALLSH